MKIALVVHDFGESTGQGRYTVQLARHLCPRHDLHIYANTFGVQPPPGVAFQRVPAWRARSILTVLSFAFASERMLRRRSYDLIHAQGLTCWTADVVTAHVCNRARVEHLRRGGLKARGFARTAAAFESRFYRQLRAQRVIAVSQSVANDLRRCYGWQKPISVIHHGIDSDRFCPPVDAAAKEAQRRRFGLRPDHWVWLFMGEAVKGLLGAIRLLPKFPQARLVVVSHSRLLDHLNLAQQLGVSDRILYLGSEREPEAVYQAADLFLYLTTYDAFGMVVTEAMASGLTVLCGRNAGAAELIKHGESGVLCDPLDHEGISRELSQLVAAPDRAREMGVKARAAVLSRSWKACAEATDAVYEEVFRQRIPGR